MIVGAALHDHAGDALYAGSEGFVRAFARSAGADPALRALDVRVSVVGPEGEVVPPSSSGGRGHVEERLVPRGSGPKDVADAVFRLVCDAQRPAGVEGERGWTSEPHGDTVGDVGHPPRTARTTAGFSAPRRP